MDTDIFLNNQLAARHAPLVTLVRLLHQLGMKKLLTGLVLN